MASERKSTSTVALNEYLLGESCRFNEVLLLISPRWKMQILFSIYDGINRFSLLKKEYPSLSKQILGKRLKELEAEGFVTKEINEKVAPTTISYFIKPKGKALLDIVPRLCEWGDKWI
ncbi:hypothetical protein A9P82_03255 [Arachidicoccus ginsenosidimutans]|uniref:winged helix-turn-helix transcriptional regulator n=1 Tax=Arachidicoccus sp. BS20 TaxID=1850526 RepID=UPI0007F183D2|nr:helix-turn-helix domain-containing protein [Arachidicoccus sp. BS20]ANI88404.1 hypothetical protein A9P82_03255 [Arachidicoccus sp. BS20]